MQTNYRRIYHRLKRRYPAIERMINTPGVLPSIGHVPELHIRFCTLTGLTPDQLRADVDKRLQFLAIITMMDDPQYFDDELPIIRKGLATALGDVLDCHRTAISHALQTVKNYRRIYPEFRDEIDLLYGKMTNG